MRPRAAAGTGSATLPVRVDLASTPLGETLRDPVAALEGSATSPVQDVLAAPERYDAPGS